MHAPAYVSRLRKEDWFVDQCDFITAQQLVSQHHYARGGSNTFVYLHGLFYKYDHECYGVAWWLPPTRVACESVNKTQWQKVLSLTRMVIAPGVPKNAASFLLAHSLRLIEKDGRFVSLVTYADESQGHEGRVYRAANWEYVGRTGPYPRWLDKNGKQVARKATKNRNDATMLSLGHTKAGSFYKHKYIWHFQ